MITNERQYKITKAALKKFANAVAAHAKGQPSPDVHPRIYEAMGDALRGEAEVLRDQLKEYERLRAGRVRQRNLSSLSELPKAIIEARIAARITQKGLADRPGVAEQQIQRWEANKYAGLSVERMQQIADALGATVTAKVRFRATAQTRASTGRSRSRKRSSQGA